MQKINQEMKKEFMSVEIVGKRNEEKLITTSRKIALFVWKGD